MPREKVLACATRLLDRGFFRIGSEDYAEENDTYGIATMGKRHVTVGGDEVTFDYEAKGGARRVQVVGDPVVARIVSELKRRRGGGEELLAFKEGRRWVDVKSADINAYVKKATAGDFSAKDFRTWSGTVLAAVALAVSGMAATSKTSRKRAKTRAVKEVARYLGNTPAVCRASYIDPRVFDRYRRRAHDQRSAAAADGGHRRLARRAAAGRGGRAGPARERSRGGGCRARAGAARGSRRGRCLSCFRLTAPGTNNHMFEVPADSPTTEVPAPQPPEAPQPEPPDAPQPDPKGPETPQED